MEQATNEVQIFEEKLNDFDPGARAAALAELVGLLNAGKVAVEDEKEIANMHCHTFFSFNGYGYSPSALAWLGKRKGIKLMGIVDFDVLDAVEEFLAASEQVGIRGSAGLETRVFIPEFSTREINSPGEPGISYHMGIGFTENHVAPSGAAILTDMRNRAASRNRAMIERLNAYLAPVGVDYEKDVMSLTPAGNATERHMLTSYVRAAEAQTADPAAFWADKLGAAPAEISELMKNTPAFKNLIRAKLMKRGGVGYAQPGPDTFPLVDDVHQMILAGDALPTITWLDGTSAGESAGKELFELLISKGAVALNIVPDRNWNIKDAETRKLKIEKLYEVVQMAQDYDLPINVGTEMNAFGLKLVDDFDAEALAPVRDVFMDGAYFIYGHTVMKRHTGFGYQSEWAAKNLSERSEKNAFFTRLGKMLEPSTDNIQKLKSIHAEMTPDMVLQHLDV
ncbi:MAG: hypothetical protein JW750_04640 [Anaerolineaceae bacterium]|nr:hypothetical protein [Anaerolineaceae bacterium]